MQTKDLRNWTDDDFLNEAEGLSTSAPPLEKVMSQEGLKQLASNDVVSNLNFGRKTGEPARIIRSNVPAKDFSFDIKQEQPVTPQQKQIFAENERAVVEKIKEIKRKQLEVVELSDADLEPIEDFGTNKPSLPAKAPPAPTLKKAPEKAVATPASNEKTKKGGFWNKIKNKASVAITSIAIMLGVGNAVKSQTGCDTTQAQAMPLESNGNTGKSSYSYDSGAYHTTELSPEKIASNSATKVKIASNSAPKLEKIVETGSITSNGTGIGKQLFSYLMEGATASQMKNLKQLQHEVQYGSILDAKNITPKSAEELMALNTFRSFKSAIEEARNGKSIHVTYKGESIPMSLDNPVIRRACEIRGIDCESKLEPSMGRYEYYPNVYVNNAEKIQTGEQIELAQIDAEWDTISANISAGVNKTIGLNAVR